MRMMCDVVLNKALRKKVTHDSFSAILALVLGGS
jgi:hypothetical protein